MPLPSKIRFTGTCKGKQRALPKSSWDNLEVHLHGWRHWLITNRRGVHTALRRIIDIVRVPWAVSCEKVTFKLSISSREKNQRSTEEITSHNFNFIRETQKEAFQKEYKALVSSTWTLSWMLFTCMTKRRGLTERDGNIELRELVEQLDQGKIVRTAANRRIKWGFNPPYAPYFGTVHETMMKAAKRIKNW